MTIRDDEILCGCGAIYDDVMQGIHFSEDCEVFKKPLEELREIAMKHKIPIFMTGQRWSPKEGENVICILPSTVPGGETMQYASEFTTQLLKNSNKTPKPTKIVDYSTEFLGILGKAIERQLEELCRDHDEAMEQQQYWWSPAGVQHQGRNDVAFEEEVGETVTPDMAADAAMLREQLRVETNVRLSLAEKQDAQKPFFTEEPKLYMMKDIETHVDRIVHLEYYENLNVVPTATGWADAITGEPLIRSL